MLTVFLPKVVTNLVWNEKQTINSLPILIIFFFEYNQPPPPAQPQPAERGKWEKILDTLFFEHFMMDYLV